MAQTVTVSDGYRPPPVNDFFRRRPTESTADEYGVNLESPPGQTIPAVYFEAVDDDHALQIMAERWSRGEVLALYHFPRGHDFGTQCRVCPRQRIWVRPWGK